MQSRHFAIEMKLFLPRSWNFASLSWFDMPLYPKKLYFANVSQTPRFTFAGCIPSKSLFPHIYLYIYISCSDVFLNIYIYFRKLEGKKALRTTQATQKALNEPRPYVDLLINYHILTYFAVTWTQKGYY